LLQRSEGHGAVGAAVFLCGPQYLVRYRRRRAERNREHVLHFVPLLLAVACEPSPSCVPQRTEAGSYSVAKNVFGQDLTNETQAKTHRGFGSHYCCDILGDFLSGIGKESQGRSGRGILSSTGGSSVGQAGSVGKYGDPFGRISALSGSGCSRQGGGLYPKHLCGCRRPRQGGTGTGDS